MTAGITVDIETIRDVINRVYDSNHDLVIAEDTCWIIKAQYNPPPGGYDHEIFFDTFDKFYTWILEKQVEIEEEDKAQQKENARINGESASFNIMDHRW